MTHEIRYMDYTFICIIIDAPYTNSYEKRKLFNSQLFLGLQFLCCFGALQTIKMSFTVTLTNPMFCLKLNKDYRRLTKFATLRIGVCPLAPTFYAHSVQSISNENGMKTKILLMINSKTLR